MNKKIIGILITIIVITLTASANENNDITKSFILDTSPYLNLSNPYCYGKDIEMNIQRDSNTKVLAMNISNFFAPFVNITYPENNTIINYPDLNIYGYAIDQIGMNYWEVYWEWESSSTTDYRYIDPPSTLVNFRVGLHKISLGLNKIRITFYNINNISGSAYLSFYYANNTMPNIPEKPSGPYNGVIGGVYYYSTNSTDPDNDDITYGWDWDGDNEVDNWTEFYHSGITCNISHSWSNAGIYNIKVKAKDTKGAESQFSPLLMVSISGNNSPPNKPSKPSGLTYGHAGISYTYESVATDVNTDNIYYMFDWDDGTDSGWIGPYNSGDTCQVSHIWSIRGSYSIKVKAKDIYDAESVWSDPLPITMPKTYNNKQIIQIFLKNIVCFPFFEKILNQII